MKKIFLIGFIFTNVAFGQTLSEGFDNVATLYTNGWWASNFSNPNNLYVWNQDVGNFTAFSGSANSSIISGWYCTDTVGTGTASNWLFTPALNLYNGDTLSFYTISYNNAVYADRLEVRYNTSTTDTVVGPDELGVGNFTQLALSINPALNNTDYPMVWTKYSIIVSGVPGGMGRIAFRYFVPNTGGSGTNGSIIGIDDLIYSPGSLSLSENMDVNTISVFPNPCNAVLNFKSSINENYSVTILNNLGETILQKDNCNQNSILNIENLENGLYVIEIRTDTKRLTKTFVKQN